MPRMPLMRIGSLHTQLCVCVCLCQSDLIIVCVCVSQSSNTDRLNAPISSFGMNRWAARCSVVMRPGIKIWCAHTHTHTHTRQAKRIHNTPGTSLSLSLCVCGCGCGCVCGVCISLSLFIYLRQWLLVLVRPPKGRPTHTKVHPSINPSGGQTPPPLTV